MQDLLFFILMSLISINRKKCNKKFDAVLKPMLKYGNRVSDNNEGGELRISFLLKYISFLFLI